RDRDGRWADRAASSLERARYDARDGAVTAGDGAMKAGDLLAFALRAVRGHRVRTALTLTGVAIGVAAVVVLTALGDGARRYVMGQFESLGSTMIAVVPGKTETTGAAAFMSVSTKDLTLA